MFLSERIEREKVQAHAKTRQQLDLSRSCRAEDAVSMGIFFYEEAVL